MEAKLIESTLTGRIERVRLKAETFEDQRILRMIIEGLASGGTRFELTRGGEPCGSFTLCACRKDAEGNE